MGKDTFPQSNECVAIVQNSYKTIFLLNKNFNHIKVIKTCLFSLFSVWIFISYLISYLKFGFTKLKKKVNNKMWCLFFY